MYGEREVTFFLTLSLATRALPLSSQSIRQRGGKIEEALIAGSLLAFPFLTWAPMSVSVYT